MNLLAGAIEECAAWAGHGAGTDARVGAAWVSACQLTGATVRPAETMLCGWVAALQVRLLRRFGCWALLSQQLHAPVAPLLAVRFAT
jgi:hypothetical protein